MADPKKPAAPTQPTTAAPQADPGKNAKPQARTSYSPNATDQTVYADGVQGIAVMGGVARIELYQTIVPGSDKQPEQRVITHRLVMPLAGLGDLSKALKSVGAALQQASEQRSKEKKSA